MAINTQKVVVGGLAAGVVLNVIDFVVNGVLLAETHAAASAALNPDLAANMESASVIAGYVVLDFVLGILLVWTYAAIRPRFGAGPMTAVIAALQLWVASGIMFAFLTVGGMFGWGYYGLNMVVFLVNVVAAASVGAFLYKEDAAAGAAA